MSTRHLARGVWPFWLVGMAAILVALSIGPVGAQQPADFPVPSGWFYTQARGAAPPEYGFMISDDSTSQFWTWFQRYGGVPVLGYPISHRFTYNGAFAQAMQKAVFKWNAAANTVEFVNVFDDLSAAGKDPWLLEVKQVPPAADWSSDAGKSWPEIVAAHLALLDLDPAIRAAYFAQDNAIQLYGLPMGARDFGNVFVIRAQRAAFQRWKVNTPWAAAGQVTVANGGDILKEAGLLPQVAVTPATLAGQLWAPPTLTPTITGTPTQTGTPTATPTQTFTPGPTATPTNTPTPAAAGTIRFDTFEAIVQSVQYVTVLNGANGPVNAFAKFAVVLLRVRNNGFEPNAVLPTDLIFRDPSGRTGTISVASAQHAAQDQYGRPGLYQVIEPSFFLELVIVWDVDIEVTSGGVVPGFPYQIPPPPGFLEPVPRGHGISFAHWEMVVKGAEYRPSFGTSPNCILATGTYLVVFASVTNRAHTSNAINIGDLRIQDGFGRMYDLAVLAAQSAAQTRYQRGGVGTPVQPNQTLDLVFVFDTATDSVSSLDGHTPRFTPILQPRSRAIDLGPVPPASNVSPCAPTPTRTPTAATPTPTPALSPTPTGTPSPTPTTVAGQWQVFTTAGTTLRAVSLHTANDGWAVGDNGAIFRWNGTAWNPQTSGVTVTLRSVEARAGNFALAAGDNGTILLWNGSTWSDQIDGTSPNFYSISLVPNANNNGWAGADNGAVYQWNGTNFGTALPVAPATARVRGIDIVSGNLGWAVTGDGDNRIYQWNGGTGSGSWTLAATGPGPLHAVSAFSPSVAWVVGANGALMQYNGSSWTTLAGPNNQTMNGVALLDAQTGWAVGNGGEIWRLQGGNWSRLSTTPTGNNLHGVYIVSATEAWAVGDGGVILRFSPNP
jgi:hypothetical protein